jgi:hypothetical protein
MGAFTVDLENQPGELARLCEALAEQSVNLLLCATTSGGTGVVVFIADDEAAAQSALAGVGIAYQLRPAITARLYNVPGAGAATFRKLAEAGINVEFLMPVRISDDEFYAVIVVDDPAVAESALGEQVIRQ